MLKSMYQKLLPVTDLVPVTALLPLLGDDMVFEILASLPVRSLLRFQCVSKSWCNLIKSDTFISTHYRKQNSNKLALMRHNLVKRSSKEELAVISFHDMNSPQLKELCPSRSISTRIPNPDYGSKLHRLLGPCNGLVLVVDQDTVLICNPSLRQIKPLPHCPFSDPRGYNRGVYSRHRKDIIISGWGFGNTCANDFNVVHLQCSIKQDMNNGFLVNQTSHIRAHLYKSTTRSWKIIGHVGEGLTETGVPRSELFFNGACHWHADVNDKLSRICSSYILTFDVSNEVFGRLEYPKGMKKLCIQSLMVLNDCLALVWRGSWGTQMQTHEVWVMKEYGIEESWSKQFVIGPYIITRPLLFNENKLLVESEKGKLVSCALDRNEVKRFRIHGIEETFRAVIYKESLFSLKAWPYWYID